MGKEKQNKEVAAQEEAPTEVEAPKKRGRPPGPGGPKPKKVKSKNGVENRGAHFRGVGGPGRGNTGKEEKRGAHLRGVGGPGRGIKGPLPKAASAE